MRDMYNNIPLPPPEVRVYCECGHIFDVEGVEDGDHWDSRCDRCSKYWDDTMMDLEPPTWLPRKIVPVIGDRSYFGREDW